MTVREYLLQVRNAEVAIRQLQERMESMKSLGGTIQYDKPLVQSTPENMTEDRLIELIDMEREIEVARIRLEKLKNKITLEIQQLNNAQYIQALYYKYVLGLRTEEISVVMNYEYNSVRKILQRAREAFGEIHGLDPGVDRMSFYEAESSDE